MAHARLSGRHTPGRASTAPPKWLIKTDYHLGEFEREFKAQWRALPSSGGTNEGAASCSSTNERDLVMTSLPRVLLVAILLAPVVLTARVAVVGERGGGSAGGGASGGFCQWGS